MVCFFPLVSAPLSAEIAAGVDEKDDAPLLRAADFEARRDITSYIDGVQDTMIDDIGSADAGRADALPLRALHPVIHMNARLQVIERVADGRGGGSERSVVSVFVIIFAV